MKDETFHEESVPADESVIQEDGDLLFAEELPEQTDLALPAAAGCASSVSTVGSSASCPSSLSSVSTVGCAGAAA